MTLSAREAQTVAFIQQHIRQHGRAPLVREIGANIGTKSRGFVIRMLDSLEAKGAITRVRGVPRSIAVRGQVEPTPVMKLLGRDALRVIEDVAIAEQTTPAVIMAQWLSERAQFEADAKARAS